MIRYPIITFHTPLPLVFLKTIMEEVIKNEMRIPPKK
jgi:hypothetical protein